MQQHCQYLDEQLSKAKQKIMQQTKQLDIMEFNLREKNKEIKKLKEVKPFDSKIAQKVTQKEIDKVLRLATFETKNFINQLLEVLKEE